MNKVILMGRLTKDPDVRYSAGDQSQAFARYTLAVDRRVRRDNNDPNAQTADFIGCVAFGKSAEFVEKYPNLCKPFSKLYTSSMDFIRNGIKEGTLKGNWGEDYTEKAEQLMELWNAQWQNRV